MTMEQVKSDISKSRLRPYPLFMRQYKRLKCMKYLQIFGGNGIQGMDNGDKWAVWSDLEWSMVGAECHHSSLAAYYSHTVFTLPRCK